MRGSTTPSAGGPATPGDQLSQTYLIEQLTALGLTNGAGAEGWKQPVALRSITTTLPDTLHFEHGKERVSLRLSDDFIAGSGAQAEHVTIGPAEVVFVGYGIEAPEYGLG